MHIAYACEVGHAGVEELATIVTGGWRVTADRERCMGTGACAFAAPDVFEVDASGRVAVIGDVAEGDERVRNAVDDCPMEALELVEGAQS